MFWHILFGWALTNPLMHLVDGEYKEGAITCIYLLLVTIVNAGAISGREAITGRRLHVRRAVVALWQERGSFTMPIACGIPTFFVAMIIRSCGSGPSWALIPAGIVSSSLTVACLVRAFRADQRGGSSLLRYSLFYTGLVGFIMSTAAGWYFLQDAHRYLRMAHGSLNWNHVQSPVMELLYWADDVAQWILLLAVILCLRHCFKQVVRRSQGHRRLPHSEESKVKVRAL